MPTQKQVPLPMIYTMLEALIYQLIYLFFFTIIEKQTFLNGIFQYLNS
jgi:hypothetical protein